MAIPKTGSRVIFVDGVKYHWLIRRKATYTQSVYGSGHLHIAVEHADMPGTTLVLFTDRQHPKDWATRQVQPVLPSDVTRWIRKAIELGWVPTAKGSQLRFWASDDQLIAA
jgi:hypothetical protein